MSKRINSNSSENLDDLIKKSSCDVSPTGEILSNFMHSKDPISNTVKFKSGANTIYNLSEDPLCPVQQNSTNTQAKHSLSLKSPEDTIDFLCECIDTRRNLLDDKTLKFTFGISPWESKLVEHKFKMLTTNDHEIAYFTNGTLSPSSGKTYNLFEHCCTSYKLTDGGRPGWKNLVVVIPKKLERLWGRKLSEILTSEQELDFFAELAANSSIEF